MLCSMCVIPKLNYSGARIRMGCSLANSDMRGSYLYVNDLRKVNDE